MQSYRKVAGKLFNQAPYDPKMFKYHNVLPTGFAKATPPKRYKVTADTAKVQGKLMNAGVYDPKLNKYGITPQNYKQQYEKVQADTLIKQELTDRVTESASGDRMKMDKRQRNYAPLIESLAQAGIVISEAIKSPADMSKLVKDTLLSVTKNYPRGEWSRRLPEALKTISNQILQAVRDGVIAPEDIPEIIADIERDPELGVEIPVAEEEAEMTPEQFRNVLLGNVGTFVRNVFDRVTTVPEAVDVIEKLFPDYLENEEAEVFQSIAEELGINFDTEINTAFFNALTNEANKIEFVPRRDAFVNIIREVFKEDTTPTKAGAVRLLAQEAYDQFGKVFVNTDIYERFESKAIAGLMKLFDTDAYKRAATELSNLEASKAIEGALAERSTAKSFADPAEKEGWVNRFISKLGDQFDDGVRYLRDAVENIFTSRLATREIEAEEEEVEEEEDIPEEEEPPASSATEPELIDYEELLDLGRNMIENAEQDEDWEALYEKLFGRGADSIMSQMIAAKFSYKDRQDALGELRSLLEDRMTELAAPEEVFEALGLARSENMPIIAESAPGSVTYGPVTLNPDGTIFLDEEGGGIIGKYDRGTLTFMDATGNTRKYQNFTQDQLQELFTNGGSIMTAMINAGYGQNDTYKKYKLDGAVMPDVFDIVKMSSRARQKKIVFENGDMFSIKQEPKTTTLVKIDPIDEKPIGPPQTFVRDAFMALMRVLTDPTDDTERQAAIKALEVYDTEYYKKAYTDLKDFFGAYAKKITDMVGFGSKNARTLPIKGAGKNPRMFNEIVRQLDQQIKGGAISKAQYVKVMRKLSRE